ncbi:MAG: type II toxin-antitoxin system RelE/ParE family toxin [Chloroherpetonaceae bacterium]|nr:type II toxin-antitoxin system RelE/ParE family toxin [Chloroherpetonaceae bacterium]
MKKIRIVDEAERDLDEIINWYNERSFELGDKFYLVFKKKLDLIFQNPKIYRKSYKKIRRATINQFPYGIYFIHDDEEIIVLAILHFKRSPKLIFSRLKGI